MWKFDSFLSRFSLGSKTSRIFLNKDGSVLTWNDRMEEIEGYKSHEIVGKKFNHFFSTSDNSSQSFEKILDVTSRKGKSKHTGIHFRKDGSIWRGTIVLQVIRDEAKAVIGFDMLAKARRR
jgi:PAS domain S-box-containing protein